MTSSSSLYGLPRPRNIKSTDPKPPTHAAFTSTLSSLLAASTTGPLTTGGRPRPSKSTKPSIFTTHNKGSKKRALADLSSSSEQTHSQTSEAIDAATLHRSKRKMEEKARLYASMKRGDYVPPSNGGTNKEENALVDFDRKWAENESTRDGDQKYDTETDDDGESADDEEEAGEDGAETVEYTDEFGRQRTTTKANAARHHRLLAAQTHASETLSEMRAHPARPASLIHGDVIQSSAFNPDAPVSAKISELAAKRDRSPTPPEEVHYDASSEVRSKGVGFYAFSKDSEGRKREMEALKREREETEKGKRERERRKEEREREIEERKRVIAKKREEKLAERFLDGLDVP